MASEEIAFEGYKSSTLSQTSDETMVVIFSRRSLLWLQEIIPFSLSRAQP